MDDKLERAARPHLEEGERILWIGRPIPRHYARLWIPIAIMVGIPFALVALGGIGMALPALAAGKTGSATIQPAVFGLPLLAAAVGLLGSPIFMAFRATRTTYAVTDRRALIVTTGLGRSVQSFAPGDMADVRAIELTDGCGCVFFARRSQQTRFGVSSRSIGFDSIRDFLLVEGLVRDLAARTGAAA
jgi:hypothetical protein